MTAGQVEPRLRRAIDASIGWYEDLFALHGVGSRLEDGLWSSLAPPPPLHSDAVVVEPTVTAEQVMARLEGREHTGFKDSFSSIDASELGMELLFAATWIHRDAAPSPHATSGAWTVVRTPEELDGWTSGHDTSEVLLPGLLERGHFKILAQLDGDRIVAGAVARLGSGVVDLSNVHADPGHVVDWADLADAVAGLFPGRPIVGYERGDDLDAALDGGFIPVGELRIWVR
ncbi:MAG TPA: hypothetical protein VF364_04585 [Candidatus Limnocylindria bacterium]